MCNTFVSNILSKKEKKWFRCLLTSLSPASHVKQAGRKALGSSHVAQFIATLCLKPHNKLLPLVVQKLTQQRLHPELIPSWRSKINHSPKQTGTSKPASQQWSPNRNQFPRQPNSHPEKQPHPPSTPWTTVQKYESLREAAWRILRATIHIFPFPLRFPL